MSVRNQIDRLTAAKAEISAAAAEKGVFIPAGTSLSDFPDYIRQIETVPLWYGIEFDTEISDPACTRIGSAELHRMLPIQSSMRGCMLNDDGEVVEYLPADDWTKHMHDETHQVMVELPAHYRKFETEGTKRRVCLSEYPLPGYHLVRKQYVSAYEATVERSTNRLCSVASEDSDYRGGNNNAAYDGTYRTLLGRPATAISRTNFRDYARRRKPATAEWNCLTYDIHKELYWLFAVEYATLNTQEPFDAELTAEGFRQGGLGMGVTTFTSAEWGPFNGYYPFVPCGHTDSLGNASGEVAYTLYNADGAALKTVMVPRYRGVENPFGHIWKWTDGINIRVSHGFSGLSKVFVCTDPSQFKDDGYDGYIYVGDEARSNGFVREVIFGEGGEIIAAAMNGTTTTHFCDYHYTNIPATETLRSVLFGGHANDGALAGLTYASTGSAPANTDESTGTRLCFIPQAPQPAAALSL